MAVCQTDVSVLVANLRRLIHSLKAAGTVGMSRDNLRAIVSTRGIAGGGNNPQFYFAQVFDAAVSRLGTVRGFDIY